MAQIRQIPIEEIDPSPWQPRTKFDDIDSLAKSILEVGLIQPVTVRPCNGRFELVAGERRWRAVRLANLPDITCIVRELSDSESRRIALAENVARKDLTSIEEAAAWAEHFDAEMWQDEAYRDYAEMNGLTSEFDRMQARQRARWLLTKMASDRRNQTDYFTNKFVGKAEAIFSNHPRRIEWETFLNHDIPLLELPQIVQDMAIDKGLNKSQARALGKLAKDESEEAQEVLGTGRITVRDGLEFVEVPIEEASAREIEKATRVKQWQNRREKFDSMDPEPLSINEPDKYRIVYADPPWFYSQVIEKYGPAERHYPTMTQEELCALGDDIKEIITSDAVLFLWSTAPKLKDAFEVAESWGFRYTGAQFIWDKVKHNYGHYNSVRHEILLICVKGSCTPDSDKLIDSVQTIERSRKHSEKPEQFRDIIDAMYPNGKRIELFARQIPQNTQRIWDIWGNEISD